MCVKRKFGSFVLVCAVKKCSNEESKQNKKTNTTVHVIPSALSKGVMLFLPRRSAQGKYITDFFLFFVKSVLQYK